MTRLTTSTSPLTDNVYGAFMKKLFKPVTMSVGALMILGLTACGQGVENRDAPPEVRSRAAVAEDVEVTYFSNTAYALFRSQQCRDCHVTGGGGNGAFADDNVNTAFSEAKVKFDPVSGDPASNQFVTKVGNGHYCWGAGCDASKSEITTALTAWKDALSSGGTLADTTDPTPVSIVALVDPAPQEPNAPVTLPETAPSQFDAVYTIVTDENQGYCSRCHSSTTTENAPQRPFFAESGYDGAKQNAYNAVVSAGLINLNNPAGSKLVVRPYPGLHNCGGDCQVLSDSIRAAITCGQTHGAERTRNTRRHRPCGHHLG